MVHDKEEETNLYMVAVFPKQVKLSVIATCYMAFTVVMFSAVAEKKSVTKLSVKHSVLSQALKMYWIRNTRTYVCSIFFFTMLD